MSAIAKQGDKFILSYDLFSLPTAQHKAGLAGLLLMIDSLKERRIGPIPVVEELTPTGARFAFTIEALQTVFNDLFDSNWEEISYKAKWQNKEPKRIEEVEVQKEGKAKREQRFVYDVLTPKGAFLQVFYPDGNGIWIKLWRDMLWNTLRSIHRTRNVYKERADEKPSSLSTVFWSSLEKAHAQQEQGIVLTESLSSSLFVGAEATNAERVPFNGSAPDNFLLHFWLIVSMIHVPRTWNLKSAKEGGFQVAREELGFVVSIPEPADLELFCEDARTVLRSLDVESSGLRPLFRTD